jgi:hypothetical protein
LWIFVTLHEGNRKLFAALQGSESGRRLLALATPLCESPLLNWCFVIPFAGVLVPQLVFMAVGEKRGKKRRRDSSVSSIPECPKVDERWDPGGTFRSALDGWNKVCEFTGKRFVPYGWDGTRFNVHPRYHDDLPLFTRECCTHTLDYRGSQGRKPKLVKAIFCPTLHFSQPVAVGDDNSNRDLSGYAQHDSPQDGMARYRFGSKANDQGELNYSPDYEGPRLTFMYVTAGTPFPTTQWVRAVNASAHKCPC